jgi:tRNA(Arg) A34 adenosine deaminase TadA
MSQAEENPPGPEELKHFMEQALSEAKGAFDDGEVPVGCVIVHKGQIIGRGRNRTNLTKNVCANKTQSHYLPISCDPASNDLPHLIEHSIMCLLS